MAKGWSYKDVTGANANSATAQQVSSNAKNPGANKASASVNSYDKWTPTYETARTDIENANAAIAEAKANGTWEPLKFEYSSNLKTYGDHQSGIYEDYLNNAVTGGKSDYKTTMQYYNEAIKYRDYHTQNGNTDRADYWAKMVDSLGAAADYDNRTQRASKKIDYANLSQKISALQDEQRKYADIVTYWDPYTEHDQTYYDAEKKSQELQNKIALAMRTRDNIQSQMDGLDSDILQRHYDPEIAEKISRLSHANVMDDDAYGKLTGYDPDKAWALHDLEQADVDAWHEQWGTQAQYYNALDRAGGTFTGALDLYGEGLLGAASYGLKVADYVNRNNIGGGTSSIISASQGNFAQPVQITTVAEGTQLLNRIDLQLREYSLAITNAENAAKSVDFVNNPEGAAQAKQSQKDASKEIKRIKGEMRNLERQKRDISAQVKALKGEPSKLIEIAQKADVIVDNLNEHGQQEIAKAKEGLGDLGQLGVDIGVTLTQQFADQLGGPASLLLMTTRVFGSDTAEQRRQGASLKQAGIHAAFQAGIEYFAEKAFGVTGSALYGKGWTGDITEKLIRELADSPAGRTFYRIAINTAEEGVLEEGLIPWLFGNIADVVAYGDDFQFGTDSEDELRDIFIGSIAGFIGAAGGVVTGANSQANSNLVAEDIKEFKALNAHNDEMMATGERFTPEQIELINKEADRVDQLYDRLGAITIDENGRLISTPAKGTTPNGQPGLKDVDSQGRVISSDKDKQEGYIERHQQSTAFEEQRKQAERTAEFLKKQQEQREAMKGSEENLDTGATIEEKKPEVPKGEQKANAKAPKKPKKKKEKAPKEKAPKVVERYTFTSDTGASVNARIEQDPDGSWHYRDDIKNEHHPDGSDLPYDSYEEAKTHLEDLKLYDKEINEYARQMEGENKAEQQAPEGLKNQEAPTASETASETQAESAPTQTQPETKELVKPGEERAEKKAPKNPDKAAAWKKAEAERTARNNALRVDIKKRVSQVADEDVTVSGTYNGSPVTAVYNGKTIQLTNAQGQPLTPITPKNRKDARKILYDIAKETRGTVESAAEVETEQSPVETTAPAETETANTEEATNPEVQQPAEVETQEVSAPVEEAETKMETPTQEVESKTEAEPAVEEAPAVTTESVADGVKSGTITPAELRQALKNPDIDVTEIRKALGMRAVNAENSLRTANTIGNMVRRYQANLAKMKSADTLTEAEKKAVEGEAKQKQKNDVQNAKEKAIRNQSIEEQLKGEELSDSVRENDESANQSGREDGNDAEPVSDISGGDVGGGLDVRSTKPGGKRKTGNAGAGVLVEPTDSRKYGSVEREIAEAYKEKNLTLDQKQQIEGSRDAWNEEYKKANVPIMASKNVSKTYKKLLAVANKYGRKFLTIRDAANARISRAESGRCLTLTSIIGPTLITHRYFPPSARRHILNLDGQSAIHEYSHDFGTVYAEEHDGNRPDYSEGLKAVTQSLVDKGLILDKDQAKFRNQLIHLYFNKVGVNSTIGTLFARKYKGSPEWKKAENAAKLQQEKSEYAKKTGKEKAEYLKTNYSTDYKEMLKTVREEIMMELVSEGSYFREVLKAKGQDISNYSKPARAWMEKDGGVPAGFYDEIAPIAAELDKENLAWLEEQDKIRNDDGTFIESASTTLDTVNEEIDLSSSQESIEDYFDYPEGATDIRQNKGIAELRSQGERIHADNVEYQSVSHQAIIDAANKTINRILNSGKYSAQDIANWFSNRSPRNADRFIMQLGKEMFYRLQQQRVSLETSGGKAVSDARLTTDVNQLSKLEESFGAWVTNAVGNAGEILGQHADLSPVVATKNNAKNSFIGNIKPGEIDPDSEGAKMYRVVDDHVSYQESIHSRKEAGKITEAEGAQLYAKEIMELSKIRDVRHTFGNAGKMMDAWERNMINWILKHDKHAYDTLRMLALGSTNRISSDFNNVGAVDTIKQVRYLFLLSNFATKVNNVLNNLESSTTGAIGQNIAVALTGKRAEKLMGEQTMTYNSNWGRLFPRGVNKELNEYMLTKGAESVLSLYYCLDVDEGIIDIDTGGRYNQNSSTAGRILARAQFLSGLGMQTTDAMAIARAYKGQEINIDKMNVKEARKQVLKKQAMENARAQMYHAESKAAKLMNNARDALNSVKTFGNDVTGKIGLGDILMPFVQVPTNVAMRAIRATPAGVFYSFGKYFRGMRALEARKAQVQTADKYRLMQENGVALSVDQQNYLRKYGNLKMPTDAEVVALQRAFGEGASNAAITLVAAVLAGMGGIRDFDDEDDKDLQRLAKERGFTGLQINLSHPFKKGNQDWDYDNDVIIGGSWLEVAALPVCAGYALYHAAIEDGGDFATTLQTVMTSPLRSINTIVDTAKEIPGMQQIGKIWDAYENLQYEKDLSKKGDKIVAGLSQYAANTLSTFVIPNQVAQFAAGIDNTVRDVYSADTNWEVAKNIFQSKIPFWRNKLPEKKSSLGETRTYGPDTLRSMANRMIIPGTGIQIWKKSELERYYEKMSKSGHTNIMVENSAPKSIKAEGQVFDLNAKERRDFDSMRDVETRKAQEALLHSEGFLSLPEDLQEVAMRDARSLVNHLTEQYTLDNKEDCTANVDLDKWEDAYKNKYEEASQFLTAKYGAKEFFKNNELLDAKAADVYLKNTYSKLDDTARELLDNSYAHLDSMYDAYSGTGMTAEQYWRVEQLRKKYAAQQKEEDNEESASALQRNLIVEYENMKDLTPEQKAWAEENKKLWINIPASTETIDKIRKVTGLTAKEADDWLDLKSNTAPLGGYKKLSQNQRLMMVRDSNYSEDKKWKLIEYEASDSAWAKLVKFRDEGKTVAEALEQARWYKPTKFTRWIEQRYDVIYDQEPGEEEED